MSQREFEDLEKGKGRDGRTRRRRVRQYLEATKTTHISKLAVEHLAECLELYAAMAKADPQNWEKWREKQVEVATRLARYQSPTYTAIAVSGQDQRDNERLARMNEKELAFELKRRCEALGLDIQVRPRDPYTLSRKYSEDQPFDDMPPEEDR